MNANVKNDYNKVLKPGNGMVMMLILIAAELASIAGFVFCLVNAISTEKILFIVATVICGILGAIVFPILLAGLRTLRPNEAYVLTLFGDYYGTVYGPGFFYVNPFASAINPTTENALEKVAAANAEAAANGKPASGAVVISPNKKVSLKEMTLINDKQKINDLMGNPIIIGTVVIWHIVDPSKAVFNVENYAEFLSTQCDAAIRNIVREYPYDDVDENAGDEKSLRGSSQEVAQRLAEEIQSRVEVAGIEITEARITHLSYAPEIAAAMLQRQQASAIIAARKLIVEGAVGMVEMALDKLDGDQIVEMDDERKAQMVSNLLVVLCGNNDAQPIVNTGSIY